MLASAAQGCLCAVRYYTAQHAMELEQEPGVKSVANLVKQVLASHTCSCSRLAHRVYHPLWQEG